ncbi:MAG: DNA alkylation repair protein [bacterium]
MSGVDTEVQAILAELKRLCSSTKRSELLRYGIVVDQAMGVAMSDMQQVAKAHGKNQNLADALWDTGWYEARTVAAYVGEPEKLTGACMDRWSKAFDNWAIVDTVCFVLFDRSPLAFGRIIPWSKRRDEFQCRAGYVLLACLASHNKHATDAQFLEYLPLLESGATDARNFVKKGVLWALRSIGGRSLSLHEASLDLVRRLAESEDATQRWVGKNAVREMTSPAAMQRLAPKSLAKKRAK